MFDTLETLQGLDLEVRRDVGQALRFVQMGGENPSAKPLKGFAGVLYVLHVFQKKSKRGIDTPKSDMDLVRKRIGDAEAHYKAHYEKPKGKKS